ncbi:MAG: NADPH:quinone reductase [Sphingomonadales bacterium]|jgi:NADPH2:quinone reductase|nr:NADPH:quinone reductase [Sphingomonadales bacterium]
MSERYRLVIRRTGGPEVIEREVLGPLAPGPGEVLIRHEAIGLNYIDTYHRSGLYPLSLPSGLGSEGAGPVEAAGEGTGFAAGERVAYAIAPPGAYATHRLIAADRLVRLPEAISAETAAAAMLKGCTAEMLVERCARVQAGEWVLVHAAAGGVGSILVPWLKAVGAKVIAHAGSPEKAALAAGLGADHALSCPFEALAGKVREITGGAGVRTIFDGVGAASWEASLASLGKRGLMVSYGNASGPVPPFSPLVLARHGSLFLTRPTLADYVADPSELQASAARLFAMIGAGAVPVRVGARFPLAEAADAHRALESRATTGSTLLIP